MPPVVNSYEADTGQRAVVDVLMHLPWAEYAIHEPFTDLHYLRLIKADDLPGFIRINVIVIGPIYEARFMHCFVLGFPEKGPAIILAHQQLRQSQEWIQTVEGFYKDWKADGITGPLDICAALLLMHTEWKYNSLMELARLYMSQRFILCQGNKNELS